MFFEKSFKNSFDFFFFLETHHKDENDIPNELMRYEDTYDIVHSPRDENNTYTGIIGLIRKEYKVTDIEQTIQGRILTLKLTDTTGETTYRFSVVYFPTNNKFELDYMQNIVQKLRLADDSDTSNFMIFGDFNFIDHDRDKRYGLSPKDTNLNKIWTPFIEEMDMVDPFR